MGLLETRRLKWNISAEVLDPQNRAQQNTHNLVTYCAGRPKVSNDEILQEFVAHVREKTAEEPIHIGVYIHKGGAGKTTTTTTLGCLLANAGLRVLLVDCDPQCNLTQFFFDELIQANYDGDYLAFVNDVEGEKDEQGLLPSPTLYDMLGVVRDARLLRMGEVALKLPAHNYGGRLAVWAGHPDLVDFDAHLASAEATWKEFSPKLNQLGAPFHAIRRAANTFKANVVLLDLGPSAGVLNHFLLMSSHYFFIPCFPDFFSLQAVRSMATKLPEWYYRKMQRAEDIQRQRVNSLYPIPNHAPKFLGSLFSRFASTKKGRVSDSGLTTDRAARNIESWMKKIVTAVEELNKSLKEKAPAMWLSDDKLCIQKIRDFHTLGALSHYYGVPVPLLRDEHFNRADGNGNMKPMQERDKKAQRKQVKSFRELFEAVVKTVLEKMSQ
ncbi:Regulatory protein CII (Modular protein) [Balamuthia mandrillaris]